VDYTREPIVETIITPKDGYRISVRSSKVPGQEEYIVEALEVVSFGTACFFRNLERPKAFMVPASDYEILEVREPRVSLKAASLEGTIRAPLPREAQKLSREIDRKEVVSLPKEFAVPVAEREAPSAEEQVSETVPQPVAAEGRHERRRERRRGQKRRRGGREEGAAEESHEATVKAELPEGGISTAEEPSSGAENILPLEAVKEPPVIPSIPTVIPPPTTLIRDDLERLRRNKQYEGAFYIREPEAMAKEEPDDDDAPIVPLRLHGDEEKTQEEPSLPPQEENIYKATPAPLEEESGMPWGTGEKLSSPDTQKSTQS
jgi:hypothetical protein